MRNAEIQNRIQSARQAVQESTQITVERVLTGLARIAFADARTLLTEEGNVDPKRISDEMAPAVAGIEWSDKGGWKVKLNDRVKALELIGRHLAMFKDRVEVQAMGQVLVYLPDNGRGGAAVDTGRVG